MNKNKFIFIFIVMILLVLAILLININEVKLFVVTDKIQGQSESNVDNLQFSYKPINISETYVDILLTIKEDKIGINKIVGPDNFEVICNKRKNEIAVDYKAEQKKEYKFKIVLENGEEKEKILIVDIRTFNYTGENQIINLEPGSYTMECFGARGGNGLGYSIGGYGGYTSGTVILDEDTELYLYIGQAGQDGNGRRESFNGGAIGGYDTYGAVENGGSGGGATDIRLSPDLSSRIMVAGGGGGAGRMV